MFPSWGEGVETFDGLDNSWMSLPRFARLWKREDIGRFSGVVAKDLYVTLSDEGDRVIAIDVQTGRDRWQTALPAALFNPASLEVVGVNVIVAHQRRKDAKAQVFQIESDRGRVGWTREVPCARALLHASKSRLFLFCEAPGKYNSLSTVVELNPKTGDEIARVVAHSPVELTPGGDLCMTTADEARCATVERGRLVERWKRRLRPSGSSARLLATANYLLRESDGSLEVMRLADGRTVAQFPAPIFPRVDARNDRLFMRKGPFLDIHRLSDGARIAHIEGLGFAIGTMLADSSQTFILPRSQEGHSAVLLGKDNRPQLIDNNLVGTEAKDLVGHVLLTKTRDFFPGPGPQFHTAMVAYSISPLAPSANQLPEQERVRAILEHLPLPENANAALALTIKVSHGRDHLETMVKEESGSLGITAIGVAGVSHDIRFLPSLQRVLSAIEIPPPNNAVRARLRAAIHALSILDDPKAAGALLGFWKEKEARIPPGDIQEELRGKTMIAVWRYSAARDWATCPALQLPVERFSATATLGTASPGKVGQIDSQGQWAVLCEARIDDDGNGRLESGEAMGGTSGDSLRPYLVLGSGVGTEIGSVLSVDPHGRRLAISMGSCLYAVDTHTGKATALARGDGRVRVDSLQEYAAVDFSSDGRHLAYVRSSGAWSQVVVRDLETGAEQTIDPGQGRLAGIEFDDSTKHLVLHVWDGLRADAAESWIRSSFTRAPCPSSGAALGRMFAIKESPELHKRLVSIFGGPVEEAGKGFEVQRSRSYNEGQMDLVPIILEQSPFLPVGPFHLRPKN